MDEAKATSAKALYPILTLFDRIGSASLLKVLRLRQDDCTTAYVLDFGTERLAITALPDDDTIELSVACDDWPEAMNVSESPVWKPFISQPFGWGWLTTNQQGYIDGAMLSFGGITPNVLLTVAASSISVQTIALYQTED